MHWPVQGSTAVKQRDALKQGSKATLLVCVHYCPACMHWLHASRAFPAFRAAASACKQGIPRAACITALLACTGLFFFCLACVRACTGCPLLYCPASADRITCLLYWALLLYSKPVKSKGSNALLALVLPCFTGFTDYSHALLAVLLYWKYSYALVLPCFAAVKARPSFMYICNALLALLPCVEVS